MASLPLFVFFVLSHLLLLHSAEEENRNPPSCSSFQCGKFGIIGFPFTNSVKLILRFIASKLYPNTSDDPTGGSGRQYEVINISYTNTTQSTRIRDLLLLETLNNRNCESLTNLSFPNSPSISYEITSPKQTLFKCNRTPNITSPENFKNISCGDYNIYYSHSNHSSPSSFSECSIIQLPQKEHPDKDELFSLLSAEFDLEVHVSDACSSCHARGGSCEHDHEGKFYCYNAEKGIESIVNRKSGTFELVLKVLSITLLRSQFQRMPT
jgi:hypothetical protein